MNKSGESRNSHYDQLDLIDSQGVQKTMFIGVTSLQKIDTRIKRPAWLAKGYVGTNHIISARMILETRHDGTRQGKLRDEPTQHEIVVHGAREIYKFYITHLHLSRDRVRTGFFYDLGFLLTD